jgi:hypothetical protein
MSALRLEVDVIGALQGQAFIDAQAEATAGDGAGDNEGLGHNEFLD